MRGKSKTQPGIKMDLYVLIEQANLIDDKARYQCHADKDNSKDGGSVEP